MGAKTSEGTGHGSARTRIAYISELEPANSSVNTSAHDSKKLVAGAGSGTMKISETDSVPDYLTNKLLPGTNITLVSSTGDNQTITINAALSAIPVVVNLGTIGPIFSPSIIGITSVIKGVVNEDVTMSNITITDGVADKMLFRIELTQGTTGGDSVIWSSNFIGGDAIPLTSIGLSVGASKTDIIIVEYDSFRGKYMIVGFIKGIDP